MPRVFTRVLGVGLAAGLAVVSLGLALTGRLALYINPESNLFVVVMAVVVLVGAAASFALPLGAEADHGHDHGPAREPQPVLEPQPAPEPVEGSSPAKDPVPEPVEGPSPARLAAPHPHPHHAETARMRGAGPSEPRIRAVSRRQGGRDHDRHDHDHADAESSRPLVRIAVATGGGLAIATVGAMLVLPPAALSAELAMSRDTGAAPLFAGSDVLQLATVGDTADFGIGDWASAFASTTDPASFDGDEVMLTGFVTPAAASGFDLTRLVITHCVIDAQPASLPVTVDGTVPATGQWVTVTGTVRSTSGGALSIVPTSVEAIDQPADPYEY